uniref:Putative nucleotidyltransferase MAB21L1 n=1 Tax=Chelydra serpentina TaxID=8475 RepID=A0A8C3XUN1_CHESE
MAGKCQSEAGVPREMEEEQAEFHTLVPEFLKCFLGDHVYPEQMDCQSRERECQLVQDLVSRIMARVHECNVELFTGEAILVGSQAQDLHVRTESSSSDYDFLAPIQYNTNLILMGSLYSKLYTPKGLLPVWDSLKPGVPVYRWGNKVVVDYNKLIMRDLFERKTVDVDLTEEDIKTINDRQLQIWKNSVDPYSVMTELWECVQEALAEGNIRLENTVGITPISPAVQLSAEVDGRAVSIDLVPTIRNKVDMSMDWPQQDLKWLSDWWDREQGTEQRKPTWNIMEIYKTGTDLVAKNSYWRLTFSLAETQLLKDIDADGGCRQKALRVLKQINMEKWVLRYGKVLTSYHLKMVLFWASDLNPETENWATVLDSLGTLLKVLEFSLEKRNLPSYFLPSMNFFDWHRSEEENSLKNLVLEVLRLEVRLMRCSPERYLQLSYDLAKPQGPGPFIQRARELDEFRRKHQKDFEKFKHLKEEKQPGQGAASLFFAQHRHLGSCLQLNVLR